MLSPIEKLALGIEGPMRWSGSFELYGQRLPRLSRSADLSELYNWAVFKAKCKICGQFSEESDSNIAVTRLHYEHCARNHGYIFDEGTKFRVKDKDLQEIITKSHEYGLPMPGFDDHTGCIKQYIDSKPVCSVHVGNEL
jgi:hypothetical protein